VPQPPVVRCGASRNRSTLTSLVPVLSRIATVVVLEEQMSSDEPAAR